MFGADRWESGWCNGEAQGISPLRYLYDIGRGRRLLTRSGITYPHQSSSRCSIERMPVYAVPKLLQLASKSFFFPHWRRRRSNEKVREWWRWFGGDIGFTIRLLVRREDLRLLHVDVSIFWIAKWCSYSRGRVMLKEDARSDEVRDVVSKII